MSRPDIRDALPDEVSDRTDGSPLPALYIGPLYRGSGRGEAERALAERLKDLEPQRGDEFVQAT